MLEKYECERLEDYLVALREILQGLTLLGLWRAKFFEKGAFYGGSALRILYGLDRFSEDLDFSLLSSDKEFDFSKYGTALEKELVAFGFNVRVETKAKHHRSAIHSAFLKGNTFKQLLVIGVDKEVLRSLNRRQLVKIKLEIDTDPPSGFSTETKYLLSPVPFAVRTYSLPDLFAGKMHAILCRKWKTRVKGRDWYDFVWFAANHPRLHLYHLEQRLRQTGDWTSPFPLDEDRFRQMLGESIDKLDVEQARKEVELFVRNPESISLWSHEFFHQVASRIIPI